MLQTGVSLKIKRLGDIRTPGYRRGLEGPRGGASLFFSVSSREEIYEGLWRGFNAKTIASSHAY